MYFIFKRLPFELYEEIGNYLSVKCFVNFKRAFCIPGMIYVGKYCGNIHKEILYILKYCKNDMRSERNLISVLKDVNVANLLDLERITLYVIRSNYTSALRMLLLSAVDLAALDHYRKIFKYVNTIETARVLIDAGNLNVNDCLALIYSCSPEITQYLIVEEKASVNVRDDKRYTPLHYVQSLEIAKILVKYGANTCALSSYNSTPLHFARSPEIAKFLLDNGGHVNLRDNHGSTPLHLAQSHLIAQVMVDYGAIVNARDLSSRTPLHLTRSVDLAKVLIANGANVNARDDLGQSPLFDYLLQNPISPQFSQLLLDNGAFVNLTDIFGRTCLNFSSTVENSKVLIARGGFDSYDCFNIDRIANDYQR